MRVEARSKPIIANARVDRKTNARARARRGRRAVFPRRDADANMVRRDARRRGRRERFRRARDAGRRGARARERASRRRRRGRPSWGFADRGATRDRDGTTRARGEGRGRAREDVGDVLRRRARATARAAAAWGGAREGRAMGGRWAKALTTTRRERLTRARTCATRAVHG